MKMPHLWTSTQSFKSYGQPIQERESLDPEQVRFSHTLQGVTRMAYSPKLWLMAIGW
jgi:hypothetical protein